MSKRRIERKRYEVRQDNQGRWGILDTLAIAQVGEDWGEDVDPFAPWEADDGSMYDPSQFTDILHYAMRLNFAEVERDLFAWEKWEPKP